MVLVGYKKINMINILITGGAGFIGSNLTIELLRSLDCNIIIFDNFSNGKIHFLDGCDHKKIHVVNGDLLDEVAISNAISGVDMVVHLAANADIAASASDLNLDFNQTIVATFNLLKAMKHHKISRMIYASGSGVYGDLGEFAPTESFGPLNPVSLYGATKLSAEGLISAFSAMFNISTNIFRFANVVGPNQTHGVVYDFIRKINDSGCKELNVLGDGMQSKSYVHVDDVINAILHVDKICSEGVNTFNVSSGDYISVRAIAKIVANEMGLSDLSIKYGDLPYGWKGDVPIVRLNDDKLRKLGWSPSMNSEQAIQMSCRQMLRKQ